MIFESILQQLVDAGRSVTLAVLPLLTLFLLFQVLLLGLPTREVKDILRGTAIAAAGLFLFLIGVSIGFLPFGHAIGRALGDPSRVWLLVPVGLVLGYVTTLGEPAVRILAHEVEVASNNALPQTVVTRAICIGVAVAVGLGLLRVAFGIPLIWIVVPGYALVMLIAWLSDQTFVAVALDAGGVATGPLANTFLLALALGASAVAGDADPLVSGLGLVALISLAPLVSVMTLGLLMRAKQPRLED